ncbi:MAG: 2-oxoacid:acceptor oxidoreductase subunit alpha [Sedimentisphaeraceae bacterium JB056]
MGKHNDQTAGVDITIVLCGQAGQGIQTVESLLTKTLKLAGYNVFATKEYMSRVRGGLNSTLIRVCDKPVDAYCHRIDILAALEAGAVDHLGSRVSDDTIIIGNADSLKSENDNIGDKYDIAFTDIAKDVGGKVYSNTVAAGVVLAILGIDKEIFDNEIRNFFEGKDEDIINTNIEASKAGYRASEKGFGESKYNLGKRQTDENADRQLLIKGAQAIGLGAIAGGCNFICSYPMSPSTGVLVFLAGQSKEFGILAEQAEDEISAINMAIGAWYAGARAIVTTSGGGFALMGEGLSLAGIIESPVVIHLAQRPGPATGLPTRTEQGDLELALYSGHGEFPRVILAPGTIEEGFKLTARAFEVADKCQVPVIILTDQYYMDSYYNIEPFDTEGVNSANHITETSADYNRYELTDDGISPRGIPGLREGCVCVDSDEHDVSGHITEDFDVRVQMVDKRLKKLDLILEDSLPPDIYGLDDYKNLIVCWGSTVNIVREAVERLEDETVAVAHFMQVYPLPKNISEILEKAEKVIVVENNATGQFAKLLWTQTGIKPTDSILKYDGIAFAVDQLSGQIAETIKGEDK